jgi:hypothetical protein
VGKRPARKSYSLRNWPLSSLGLIKVWTDIFLLGFSENEAETHKLHPYPKNPFSSAYNFWPGLTLASDTPPPPPSRPCPQSDSLLFRRRSRISARPE